MDSGETRVGKAETVGHNRAPIQTDALIEPIMPKKAAQRAQSDAISRNRVPNSARARFAALLSHHIRNGTHPDIDTNEPWTFARFASVVKSSRLTKEYVSPRTVSNWCKGHSLPTEIEPILRALFGSDKRNRHAEARTTLRQAFTAARAENAPVVLEEPNDPVDVPDVSSQSALVSLHTTQRMDQKLDSLDVIQVDIVFWPDQERTSTHVTAYLEPPKYKQNPVDVPFRQILASRLATFIKSCNVRDGIIETGIRNILDACFFLEKSRGGIDPHIYVDNDIRSGVYWEAPYAEFRFALDMNFKLLKKRDKHIRWIWVTIQTDHIRLSLGDEEGNGYPEYRVPLGQMKLNFSQIAKGAVIVASKLGMSPGQCPTRPFIWSGYIEHDSREDEYIRINLLSEKNSDVPA